MDVVGGKWKSLILWELHEHGTRRFGELRRNLPGVSEKMLNQQLRELAEDGIVHREIFAEIPPRVEYSLTAEGALLNAALAPLGEWGRRRAERIGAKRAYAPGHETPSGETCFLPSDPAPDRTA
ncbi:winged helix-turn-helix transcriptional regulator [Nocardia inohanensis]|uniref:winged helix-turn-helix transcriptional regulator n=1 Tax=Nocardia inohanensis TaxID=209246 RepID=UPI000A01D08C|nr:helix-turn-helix domain-containing protein [Nocardia inohanensis]